MGERGKEARRYETRDGEDEKGGNAKAFKSQWLISVKFNATPVRPKKIYYISKQITHTKKKKKKQNEQYTISS